MILHRNLLFLLFLVAAVSSSVAQVDSLFSKFTFIQVEYDTNFVRKGISKWDAHIFMHSRNNSFSADNPSENQSVYFDPLSNISLGVGGSYQNFVVDLAFPVKSNEGDSAEAIGLDFSTSLYVGQHASDLGLRFYRGYYVSGYDSVKDELSSVFRDDISTVTMHLSYLYNFNFRRYSLNASFVGRETQLKSAGAPLAGLYFVYSDLHANESIIPPEFDIPYPSNARISEANIWTLGIMGGYAYTFVLPSHFFLTLSLAPGFGLNTGEAKTEEYFHIGNPINPSFKLLSKNAFGYSHKRFYGYLMSATDRSWVGLGDGNWFKHNMGKWKLLVGYTIGQQK